MKERPWQIDRQFVPTATAHYRWDSVYQFVLSCTLSPADHPVLPTTTPEKENADACRVLCARVEPAAGSGSDH